MTERRQDKWSDFNRPISKVFLLANNRILFGFNFKVLDMFIMIKSYEKLFFLGAC